MAAGAGTDDRPLCFVAFRSAYMYIPYLRYNYTVGTLSSKVRYASSLCPSSKVYRRDGTFGTVDQRELAGQVCSTGCDGGAWSRSYDQRHRENILYSFYSTFQARVQRTPYSA